MASDLSTARAFKRASLRIAAYTAVASAVAAAPAAGSAGADVEGARSAADRGGSVTLRHATSGFRIRAPRGFKLEVRKGVYVLSKGGATMSFSRSLTSVTPTQFGTALLGQLGGKVVSRRGNARRFEARVDLGPRRETFVVASDGKRLAVTTSSSLRSRSLSVATVRRVGASARGGIALRAPESQTSIPLTPYRAPDGGATAQVPAEPGWDIQSTQGTIQGSSERGAFLFGFSINVFLPQTAPPGTPSSVLVSPYLNAADALTQIFPRLSPAVSEIQIRGVIQDAVLPTFSSSAMYLIDYKLNGVPWTGAATIATDSPEKYSNFVWNMYYSAIGVPVGTDPAVGVGLLRSWKSWDPSGAIAERTRRARELMNETNDVWRATNEFRGRTADQQSRDVGCLLSGYYVIEDNSRKYDLPPLPCGEIYVKR